MIVGGIYTFQGSYYLISNHNGINFTAFWINKDHYGIISQHPDIFLDPLVTDIFREEFKK